MGYSCNQCYRVCLFPGIGWGMVAISAMVSVYYNVIIMYAIYYMFVSFVNLDGEVPWKGCDNPWNTNLCRNISYPDFDSMNASTQVAELTSMLTMFIYIFIYILIASLILKSSCYMNTVNIQRAVMDNGRLSLNVFVFMYVMRITVRLRYHMSPAHLLLTKH